MKTECDKLAFFVEKNSAVVLAMRGQIRYTIYMGKEHLPNIRKAEAKAYEPVVFPYIEE